MSLATDLTAREAELIRIIKLLAAQKNKFVVIGGYAVNAITSHRFSVDCDLVIARKNVTAVEKILGKEGYRGQKRQVEHATVEKFTKLIGGGRVSVDLFIDQVICRQTGGKWTYDFIRRNSFESDVVGLTDSARAFVPRKELVIAMKVHTARGADLRDVVMMSERADWKLVSRFADTGVRRRVVLRVASALEAIHSNQFSSALKAEFSLSADVTPLIKKSVQGLNVVNRLFSA